MENLGKKPPQINRRKIIEVRVSQEFFQNLQKIYTYGIQTFGVLKAKQYRANILYSVENLKYWPFIHSECRFLRTKTKIYRNIVFESHLVIYRILQAEIHVLDIIHTASSIAKIRSIKNVKIQTI